MEYKTYGIQRDTFLKQFSDKCEPISACRVIVNNDPDKEVGRADDTPDTNGNIALLLTEEVFEKLERKSKTAFIEDIQFVPEITKRNSETNEIERIRINHINISINY